jgi:hypothetical protein
MVMGAGADKSGLRCRAVAHAHGLISNISSRSRKRKSAKSEDTGNTGTATCLSMARASGLLMYSNRILILLISVKSMHIVLEKQTSLLLKNCCVA